MLTRTHQKRLGEVLIERGLLTAKQLEEALAEQKRTKEFIGRILVDRGMIEERSLLEVLSSQYGIPLISLKNRYIDWEFVKTFSPSLILDYGCFPITRDEWSVTIAITNPLDVWSLKEAEREAGGLRLRLVLVSGEDMQALVKRYRQYRKGGISKLFG